jgi:hypothetical protein
MVHFEMRTILLSIYLIFTLSSFSQQKVWSGDTTYWYDYQKQITNKFALDDLSKSQYQFAFRISSLNSIMDIWTEDGKKFLGRQTFFTCTSEDNPDKIEFLSIKETIREDTAKLINQLVGEYRLQSLPVQDSIKGWGTGFDGTMYFIEFSTAKSYSFKSYWTPQAFPSMPEAVTITNFVSEIESILMQNQKFDSFINSLPTNKSYRYGNSWTGIRINCKTKKKK